MVVLKLFPESLNIVVVPINPLAVFKTKTGCPALSDHTPLTALTEALPTLKVRSTIVALSITSFLQRKELLNF